MLAANASRCWPYVKEPNSKAGDHSTGDAIRPATRLPASDADDCSRPQPTPPHRYLCFERHHHSVKTLRLAPAERRSD